MESSTISAEKKFFPDIEIHFHEAVAVVKMNHGSSNALDKMFMKQLCDCFDLLFGNKTVKVIVLASMQRFAFCSGLDLIQSLQYHERDEITDFLISLSRSFMVLANFVYNSPKPVVAAIGGVTIGLGVQLAALCDFRICSELAWFSIPEMAVGGVYPTIPLSSQIGPHTLEKIILFGEKVDAEKALEIGLIDKIVKHRMTEQDAIDFSLNLSLIDPLSVNLQRKLFRNQSSKLMLEEQRELLLSLRKAVNRETVMERLKRLKATGNIMELNEKN